jgi:hypothetical protein
MKQWVNLVAKHVVILIKLLSVFFWLKDIRDVFLRKQLKSNMKKASYSWVSVPCCHKLNVITFWLRLKKKDSQILEVGRISTTVKVIVWFLRVC